MRPKETASSTQLQDLLPLGEAVEMAKLPPGDFAFLRPLRVTPVFSTYWRFAAERQRIFLSRFRGESQPWTADPILQIHKFTNAYRASDRVSQYLLRNVIYDNETRDRRDTLFRILLFKMFNKVETWELLQKSFGDLSFKSYSFDRFDQVLTDAMAAGTRLYSAAYIMPSGGRGSEYQKKHRMHLRLIETMIHDKLQDRLARSKSMLESFDLIKAYPSIGDFLAYQYLTDINYSEVTNFKERDFAVPGPGARDGIRKCFSDLGGLTETELIKFVAKRQEECFEAVGVSFPTLWGRRLQPIDCQNLFCEVDKYSRVAHPEISGISGRTRIKQKFKPSIGALQLFYPPKWEINDRMEEEPEHVPNSIGKNRE